MATTTSGALGARLLILAAAALFSTGGAAIKACGFTSWQVAGFRSGFAVLVLVALLPQARRGYSWRALAIGVSYATCLVLFVTSTKLTTAANTIFLQSAAPLYVMLLGPWFLAERLRWSDLITMGVIAGGLATFIVGTPEASETAPDPRLGDILAIASGVAWAITIVGLRSAERLAPATNAAETTGARTGTETPSEAPSAMPAVICGNALVFLGTLPLALPVANASAKNVALVGYLGVFQIGLAYACLLAGMRRVTAFEASLLLLFEPVLNPVWAYLVTGEIPRPLAIVGAVLILAATTAKALRP